MPCVAVTAFACALGASVGLGAARLVLLGVAILSGHLSNDLVDAGLDRSAGRKDKPLATGAATMSIVWTAFAAAALTCVVTSLALGWLPGVLHLIAVASAYSYDLALKSTLLSWSPFALSFGLLPAVVTTTLPDRPWPPVSLFVAGAALGIAAHLANTVKDIDADAATGVRGFPQRIGPRASLGLAAVLVAIGAVVIGLGRPHSVLTWVFAAAAVGSAIVAALGRRGTAFAATVVAAGLLVVVVVITGSAIGS
jgi:4-hydroxybenzoate polyprenyltransferase